MTKQEFLAMSLPHELKMIQSRKEWFTPEPDRVILLTGLSELDNKMPEQYQNINCEPTVFYRIDEKSTGNDYVSKFKPICRPLSDLAKEIEHKGEKFVPYKKLDWEFYSGELGEYISFGDMHSGVINVLGYLSQLQLLLSWHFDIADLISKGEAIDVNALEENPYK